MVQDAIQRELARDGQVLVIYNRVETIEQVAEHIKKLVPDAVVDIAHGQMAEKALYNAVSRLYNKETDVLVSTTLIENGVDLPSANTLICIDSQNLGLSTLYQLKGRVGRSSRLGYAYFTYPEHKSIGEQASGRLEAIGEFTSLGSGFKIAMRDLQMRGAGNILGKEQHGNISRIGFYMYNRLLKETLDEIKGKKHEKPKECKIIIDIDAYIPNDYVPDNESRFLLYNKISTIDSMQDYTKQQEVLTDQYGSLPREVINLMKVALIQNLAQSLGIVRIITNINRMVFFFGNREKILAECINNTIRELKAKVSYNLKDQPTLEFTAQPKELSERINFVINFLSVCNNINN